MTNYLFMIKNLYPLDSGDNQHKYVPRGTYQGVRQHENVPRGTSQGCQAVRDRSMGVKKCHLRRSIDYTSKLFPVF